MKHLRRTLNVFLALLALLVIAVGLVRILVENPWQSEYPKDWNLSEIEKPLSRYGTASTTHILAWNLEKIRSLQHRNRCLVLQRLSKADGSQKWVLACLIREKPHIPDWDIELYWDCDGGCVPAGFYMAEEFSQRPSNWQIHAFLNRHRWRFELSNDSIQLQAAVCSRAWKRAVGEDPGLSVNRNPDWLDRLRK